MSATLTAALDARRVLICVGSGGVGKTTVSAALALTAGARGRSALVCTIDPARRLANALGLSELGNEEARLPEAALADGGVEVRAPVHAMMLDMKRSWDELIARHAPADKVQRILDNRFYQSLSSALAGSQEYIAMEKLWELRSQRDYGVIVLDTPPTAHALDFLDAPNRMLDFLDTDAARWFVAPALKAGKLGFKLFSFGSTYFTRVLGRLTGAETLQELANFLVTIGDMNEGFRERARSVRALLAEPSTGFVLVTAPMRERMDEAIHFHRLLQQNRMRVEAVVVNRVHSPPSADQRAAAETLPEPLRSKVKRTLEEAEAVARGDAAGIAQLVAELGDTPLVRIPRFEADVHDIAALWRTSRYLTLEDAVRP